MGVWQEVGGGRFPQDLYIMGGVAGSGMFPQNLYIMWGVAGSGRFALKMGGSYHVFLGKKT